MDTLRLFVSVNIDSPGIKASIREFQQQLDFKGIKVVDPDLFHFSLHFLGDTSKELIPQLASVLSSVKQVPFEVKLEQVGVFPSLHNIKVIWVGVSTGATELSSLKQQLDRPLQHLGFTIDERSFTPHLTVGRVKFINPDQKKKIQNIITSFEARNFGSQHIDSLHLMQSTLRPEGPSYQSLVTQELHG